MGQSQGFDISSRIIKIVLVIDGRGGIAYLSIGSGCHSRHLAASAFPLERTVASQLDTRPTPVASREGQFQSCSPRIGMKTCDRSSDCRLPGDHRQSPHRVPSVKSHPGESGFFSGTGIDSPRRSPQCIVYSIGMAQVGMPPRQHFRWEKNPWPSNFAHGASESPSVRSEGTRSA